MLNYLKDFVSDCKAGYRAATSDFKAGFVTGDRTTDTLDSQVIATRNSMKGKKTVPGTVEDDARKAAHAKLKELNVLAAASRKCSTAFKVGRWMRNPLINTWKFVKSWVVGKYMAARATISNASIPTLIASTLVIIGTVAAAIYTLGVVPFVIMFVGYYASISVGRLFAKLQVPKWIETLMDVMLAVVLVTTATKF